MRSYAKFRLSLKRPEQPFAGPVARVRVGARCGRRGALGRAAHLLLTPKTAMKKRERKALVAAIKQMKRRTFRTSVAVQSALRLIESSEKRIARLEAAAKRKPSPGKPV